MRFVVNRRDESLERSESLERGTKRVLRESVRSFLLLSGLLVLVLAMAAAAAGCGAGNEVGDAGTLSTTGSAQTTTTISSQGTTTTAPSTTTTTPAAETTTLRIYFIHGGDLKIFAATRVIPKTQEVGAAAVRALLEGPSVQETAAGLVTSVPEGTTFLGLEIKDGVATVDLSKEYGSGGGSLSMWTRLAQVVFTLTQFPTVDGVTFKLDGEPIEEFGGEGIIVDRPLDRERYERDDLYPAILVESPTVGQTVSSPLRITGTANVFEGVFSVNLVDQNGLIIAEQFVTATSGTGTRGTFDVTLPFAIDQATLGSLIVFAESPKDGSRTEVIEIPLQFER